MAPPTSDNLLGTLSPAKKKFLLQRLRRKNRNGNIPREIFRRSKTETSILSHAQERLWVSDQLKPNQFVYNIAVALRLRGRLESLALQKSLDQIVIRHEVLRTTFHIVSGEVRQVISEPRPFPLVRFNLMDLPEIERELQATRLVVEESNSPFSLADGPLLRVTLLQLSPADQLLLFTVHHIVADGWSMGVLVREFKELYEAYTSNRIPSLPELPIQYSDYAAWQRESLRSGEVVEKHLSFWRERLTEVPVLPLPTDHSRPAIQSYVGKTHTLFIDSELMSKVKKLGQREGATLFMTLLAAFKALLYRYTAQEDVVVGTPVAGRTMSETENLIGLFVNSLVLRTDISGDPTFTEVLKRVKAVTLDAFMHQDIPFDRLLQDLAPNRDASRMPFFQVVFALQNAPLPALSLPGLSLNVVDVERRTAKTDLTLSCTEMGQKLEAIFEYNTDLFDGTTIERMGQHFKRILEAAVTSPEVPIRAIELLAEQERYQQLIEWNSTKVEASTDLCIHQMFEAQTLRNPELIAVSFQNERLTYYQLNRRANQLAHFLQSIGVGPEVLVGICVEKSVEMVVGILGVLKAGGAYLPIDPSYPEDRRNYLLEDAKPKVLLTQSHLLCHFSSRSYGVVSLDPDWAMFKKRCAENPICRTMGSNLAYVIYTSGSTGRPKGVLLHHRGLCNLVLAQSPEFGIDEGSHVLQLANLAFDASVSEIFTTLTQGGTLHLVPESQKMEGSEICRFITDQKISTVTIPPSLLQVLPQSDYPYLRTLVVAGETCPEKLAKQWAKGRHFLNAYGPTEFTVCASIDACSVADEKPLIGRPIRNTRIYILDACGNLVPQGVTGEIYLGGIQIGRGYLHRPEFTAEKFVPDGFSGEAGARLYRTGDLGRWTSTGKIEFLGRIDSQVKIRGFRIELGEIENALREHKSIQDAVVLTREDALGEKRLVAYGVVKAGETIPTFPEIRAYLQKGLPEYLLPTAFIPLERMPLTVRGKIDRGALPEPQSVRGEQGHAFVAPGNHTEQVLAGIWSEVLKLDKVGVEDNFFSLGGDSILAIQMAGKAKQVGIEVTVQQLFQNQTIRTLSATTAVREFQKGAEKESEGPVNLTPIQRWFVERNLERPDCFSQAVLLKTQETLAKPTVESAVRAVLSHHDALRFRFRRTDLGWKQTSEKGEISGVVTEEDLSGLTESAQVEEIGAIATKARQSLSLDAGPLMRVVLISMGQGRPGRALVVVHHLVVDAISWRILLEDFQMAYGQICRKETVDLGAKTTSFQSWAKGLVEYAQTEPIGKEIPFWRSLTAPMPLPQDSGGENTGGSVQTIETVLDEAQTCALLTEVPRAYRSQINEVLVTALSWALSRWTGQSVVRFDLEGHGREELGEAKDLSRTIGWFTTLFPVEIRIPENEGMVAVLSSIKEQLRAIPQRGIGYGILRYLRQLDLEVPPSDVSFNYLGQLDHALPPSSGFSYAEESIEAPQSPNERRAHLLEINGGVIRGCLRFRWGYSENRHRRETIQMVSKYFTQALRDLIEHCRRGERGRGKASEFDLVNLSHDEFERIVGNGAEIEDIYPLAPMQQGMLFHALKDSGTGLYVEHLTFKITSGFSISRFRAAWDRLIERHAVLRTRFAWEGLRDPLQIVQVKAELPWVEEDWSDASEKEQAVRLSDLLKEDRRQGFELRRAPLVRVRVIRLKGGSHRFVLSHHHLLLDGWSLPILIKELLAEYESDGAVEIKSPRPFRDYLKWLARQDPYEGEQYWREYLKEFKAAIALGEEADSLSSIKVAKTIGEVQTQALARFARMHGLTTSTILQGAWALLLSRCSGESDIVFGTTVSGRTVGIAGMESMVGLFINTVPVRTQIESEKGVVEWLRSMQRSQAVQITFQHNPLYQVQKWSEVPAGEPIFKSLFVVENYPVDETLNQQNTSLLISDVQSEQRTNYPLTVIVAPGRQIVIRIEAVGRFTQAGVERMGRHFEKALVEIVSSPQKRVSEIDLLSKQERHRQLVEWNATGAEYPREACIHELFEEQVERTPDGVALIFQREMVTYAELNRRSNQLAHHLQSLGVGPEVLVGVCVDRSVEMVVGIMGILKAGGAYVPIDPTYPIERQRYLLDNASPLVLLTQSHLSGRFSDRAIRSLSLDTEWKVIASESAEKPPCRATSANLAYVIYTSGSTGMPKGAMNCHRGAVNRLYWMQQRYPLNLQDRLMQKTPFSFDVSVWELFWPLLNGAVLVITKPEGHRDGRYLVELIEKERINIVHFVPSMLKAFLEEPLAGGLSSLKQVFSSGEALSFDLAHRFRSIFPDVELHNLYGPTECAIEVTAWACGPRESLPHRIPIGRPIANSRIYILDAQGRPAPIGIAGELHIGGMPVGRGYWKQSELTAEKFIPDAYSGVPGARLYRTGDSARWSYDGTLEFMGRLDHQVKIRGYRIEPGEIESALREHEDIHEAVVVVQKDEAGEKRLVGYVVPKPGRKAPEGFELRAYLQKKLPEYLVPAAIVCLKKLPLTASGKIDRRGLPAVLNGRTGREREFVAPRSPLEKVLAEIWAGVIGIPQVGVYDNFFDLGGHSLLAVRVASLVRLRLGRELRLAMVYEAPTISELARRMAKEVMENSVAPQPIRAQAISPDLGQALIDARTPIAVSERSATLTPFRPPRTVLLTGAHGFLGIFLLSELCKRAERVEVLLRCSGSASGRESLIRQASAAGVWIDPAKIEVVPGDLAIPRLGWNPMLRDRLARETDSVLHCGALVHHLHRYPAMRATNVEGTRELLGLALEHKQKPFCFVSTQSVATAVENAGVAGEEILMNLPNTEGGYLLTKWVGEQLVADCSRRYGLPVVIARPGNITGSSVNGFSNYARNHFWLFQKGCFQLGNFPDIDASVEMMPVDILARAIASLALDPPNGLFVANLANPRALSMTSFFQKAGENGFIANPIPAEEWQQQLGALSDSHALSTIKEFYYGKLSEGSSKIEQAKTMAALRDRGATLDCEYDRLVPFYLDYLSREGFL